MSEHGHTSKGVVTADQVVKSLRQSSALANTGFPICDPLRGCHHPKIAAVRNFAVWQLRKKCVARTHQHQLVDHRSLGGPPSQHLVEPTRRQPVAKVGIQHQPRCLVGLQREVVINDAPVPERPAGGAGMVGSHCIKKGMAPLALSAGIRFNSLMAVSWVLKPSVNGSVLSSP